MSLQIPSLQPKAAPVDTYVRAGSPNAPGAVSLGQLAKLPEPAEIQNTKNLVNSLSSLNNVYESFFITFTEYFLAISGTSPSVVCSSRGMADSIFIM